MHRPSLQAAAILVSISMAGCGGGDSTSASSAPLTPAATTTTATGFTNTGATATPVGTTGTSGTSGTSGTTGTTGTNGTNFTATGLPLGSTAAVPSLTTGSVPTLTTTPLPGTTGTGSLTTGSAIGASGSSGTIGTIGTMTTTSTGSGTTTTTTTTTNTGTTPILLAAESSTPVTMSLADLPYRDPGPLQDLMALSDSDLQNQLSNNWPATENLFDQYIAPNVTLFPVPLGFYGPMASCRQTHEVPACREFMRQLIGLMQSKAPA